MDSILEQAWSAEELLIQEIEAEDALDKLIEQEEKPKGETNNESK